MISRRELLMALSVIGSGCLTTQRAARPTRAGRFLLRIQRLRSELASRLSAMDSPTLWHFKHRSMALGWRLGDAERWQVALESAPGGRLRFREPVLHEAHLGQYAFAVAAYSPETTTFEVKGLSGGSSLIVDGEKRKARVADAVYRLLDIPEWLSEEEVLLNPSHAAQRFAALDLSWIIGAVALTSRRSLVSTSWEGESGTVMSLGQLVDAQKNLMLWSRKFPDLHLLTEFGVHTLGAFALARPVLSREQSDELMLDEMIEELFHELYFRPVRSPFPESEASLAGHVLEIANSPIFDLPKPVKSNGAKSMEGAETLVSLIETYSESETPTYGVLSHSVAGLTALESNILDA